MLEITFSGPGKNCNGMDKVINKYNGYAAEQRERQQLKKHI